MRSTNTNTKTFHTQGENSNKVELFPWGPREGFVAATPARADKIIEYRIWKIIRRGSVGPITPRNNFVFVRNRLPNLFAGRPEMTRALPAEIGSIKGGVGHATPSGSAILYFFDGESSFHNWALQAAQ